MDNRDLTRWQVLVTRCRQGYTSLDYYTIAKDTLQQFNTTVVIDQTVGVRTDNNERRESGLGSVAARTGQAETLDLLVGMLSLTSSPKIRTLRIQIASVFLRPVLQSQILSAHWQDPIQRQSYAAECGLVHEISIFVSLYECMIGLSRFDRGGNMTYYTHFRLIAPGGASETYFRDPLSTTSVSIRLGKKTRNPFSSPT